LPLLIPVPKWPGTQYLRDMKENRRTTYRISEAARELGISIEWLRKGEARDLDDRDLYILAGMAFALMYDKGPCSTR
jgi:hypothetical protein